MLTTPCVSCVTCPILCVKCQASCVTCHVWWIRCYLKKKKIYIYGSIKKRGQMMWRWGRRRRIIIIRSEYPQGMQAMAQTEWTPKPQQVTNPKELTVFYYKKEGVFVLQYWDYILYPKVSSPKASKVFFFLGGGDK